jgi:septum formation protein
VDHAVPFPSDFRLVLASQSPRRHSLLRDLGIPFTVVVSLADELVTGYPVAVLAETNAVAKVKGAALPADAIPGTFVLGTDTLVVVDDWVMGKPAAAPEAARMLGALSGRTHQVVSGVALARVAGVGGRVAPGEVRTAHAVTDVTFAVLGQVDIEAYLASGEWKGKAGAYAIQGLAGLWASSLHGEYSNVVGLPLHLLACLFKELGFDLVRREWLEASPADHVVTAAPQEV